MGNSRASFISPHLLCHGVEPRQLRHKSTCHPETNYIASHGQEPTHDNHNHNTLLYVANTK